MTAAEAKITIVRGERLDLKSGVHKEGSKIISLQMENGRIFSAKVFIDASYEGDVMAKAGDRSSGLLPGVNPDAGGEDGTGDRKIQGYCYRMCLCVDPTNSVPIEKPAGYRPEDYELLLRSLEAGQKVALGQAGRRMIGEFVETEHALRNDRAIEQSIGMGSYGIDSRHVQRYVDAGGHVRNEGNSEVPVPHPYCTLN